MKKKLLTLFSAIFALIVLISCGDDKKPQEQLATPVISLTGNIVSWDAVANAESYVVTKNNVAQAEQTSTTYTISDVNAGNYVITVIAKGTGYKDSNASTSVTYIKEAVPLTAPVISKIDNIVSWNIISGAKGYIVSINGNAQAEQTTLSYTVSSKTPGNYVITVVAVSANTLINTNSAASNSVTITVEKVIESIEIATNPTTLSYIEGQTFDPTGLVVKAVYNDGTKEVIPMDDLSFDLTTLSITDEKVVVSYGDFTANIYIEVSSTAYVNNLLEFNDALPYASKIILLADIDSSSAININANLIEKNLNIEIDLNGFSILNQLNIRNENSNYLANITISNSKTTGYIGGTASSIYYGLCVFGNENLNVTLNNIKFIAYYGGLYTNGSYTGAQIEALNCTFEGVDATESVGSYLAATYDYKFTNCTFTGYDGLYIKSGTHYYLNCNFTATGNTYYAPTYNGSGCNPTGNAITVDSCGYSNVLDVTFANSNTNWNKVASASGYAIEEIATKGTSNANINIIGYFYYNNAAKGIKSENSKIVWTVKDLNSFNQATGSGVYKDIINIYLLLEYTPTQDVTLYSYKWNSSTANSRDLIITLDLNGRTISTTNGLQISNYNSTYNYYGGKVDVSLVNTSNTKSIISTSSITETKTGLFVVGDDNVKVTINNITFKGNNVSFQTNGSYEGATIVATNTTFEATGIGAYLPANYNYSFENCIFKGNDGAYLKSGTYEFNDCTFIATGSSKEPVYNANGISSTGNALTIDSAQGYTDTLNVTIIECTFESLNRYAIEEIATKGTCYSTVAIYGINEFNNSTIKSQNNVIKYYVTNASELALALNTNTTVILENDIIISNLESFVKVSYLEIVQQNCTTQWEEDYEDLTLEAFVIIDESVNVIFDLNGYSFIIYASEGLLIDKANGVQMNSISSIVNKGNLTVLDSSETKTGKMYNVTNVRGYSDTLVNFGTLTVLSGTYGNSGVIDYGTQSTYSSTASTGAAVRNFNLATIKGGEFKGGYYKSGYSYSYVLLSASSNAILNVENAKVDGNYHGIFALIEGTINVYDGEYALGTTGTNSYYIFYLEEGTINVYGGSFEKKAGAANVTAYICSDYAKLNIYDGTYTNLTNANFANFYSGVSANTIVISGGTFSGSDKFITSLSNYIAEENEVVII